MTPLDELSVVEAVALVGRGALSPVELVTMAFARVDELEPTINAFISLRRDEAFSEARAAEQTVAQGDARPLEGVPVALKDNIAVRGAPTTAGSLILADTETQANAQVVSRLRAAGAIVIGKTNLHEFCLGGTTSNPHFGATRNPWALDRIPGGSSGGSAAAVAAGECLVALGTDTGGSVRVPAALNGATGLRPTIGVVSNDNVVPLAWSLDTVGPIGRTTADCARLMSVIADNAAFDSAAESRPQLSDLRIGVLSEYGVSPTAAVKEALDRAVAELCSHVQFVEEVDVPYYDQTRTAQAVIELSDAAAFHDQWFPTRADEYGTDVRELIELGRHLTAADYVQAQRFRSVLRAALASILEKVDVLVCPTTPFPAPRAANDLTTLDLGDESDEIWSMFSFAEFASLGGLPALSLPCGVSPDGLPIAMQLVGRPFADRTLLDLGGLYQELTTWHEALPAQVPRS